MRDGRDGRRPCRKALLQGFGIQRYRCIYTFASKALLGAEKRLFRRGGREGNRFSTNGRRMYSPSFQRLAVHRPTQARWTFSPAKALREWKFSRLNSRRQEDQHFPASSEDDFPK